MDERIFISQEVFDKKQLKSKITDDSFEDKK